MAKKLSNDSIGKKEEKNEIHHLPTKIEELPGKQQIALFGTGNLKDYLGTFAQDLLEDAPGGKDSEIHHVSFSFVICFHFSGH